MLFLSGSCKTLKIRLPRFARNDKFPYFSVIARRDDEAISTYLALLQEAQVTDNLVKLAHSVKGWDGPIAAASQAHMRSTI